MVSLEVPFADFRRMPQGALFFGESGCHWRVIEASAVTLPSIGMETGDPQIGLPLPKPIKGIMVGAEVLGHPGLPSNGAVEHPAKCDTIDGTSMDAEPNDPAGILIHDDQDPVGPQRGRFAPEQI
jgi:hypothetical protein